MRSHQAASVRFKRFIVNPDGSEIPCGDGKWTKNLLLNSGLDGVATTLWCDSFLYGVLGTGTNPVRRDSTPTTFTVSGGTITASAGFFTSADVTRILKTNDPLATEMVITGYTSPTVVTTSSAATIATGYTGTVWYVSDTTLGSEVKRTNTYTTSSGNNGSTFLTDTWTHQRTYLFSAETGTITYREIGWAKASTGTLFGRALIAGAGDTLVAGQQYKVIIQLSVKYSPASPTAVPDVSGGAYNTAGTFSIDRNSETSTVNSVGATVQLGNGSLEPSTGPLLCMASATFTQSSMASTSPTIPFIADIVLAKASYVAGSFQNVMSGTADVNTGNYTCYGFFIDTANASAYSILFTTPQTKDNLHTLTPTITMSWGRILTN